MRVGIGYDIHKFGAGEEVVLGGVSIPYDKGLVGHSDADVLVHAICDALLGAGGEGDIGYHFPDTELRFKGISSLILLKDVGSMIKDKGFDVVNIDSVVIAQGPRIAHYREEMKDNIAGVLGIDRELVNIKATTNEGIGSIGMGEGIAAYAICLLKSAQ